MKNYFFLQNILKKPVSPEEKEFAIILTNTTVKDGLIVAKRIRQQFSSHSFVIEGASVLLTLSLGIYELHPSDDIQGFVKQADNALYQAKAKGRNRTVIADHYEKRGSKKIIFF
ncbi:MAG: diguanylate cyclase [Desulfamplus sp.]|nr:diguanylate cyclase [Desulfamplus sp.]